jgi:hypothetical protein
MTVKRHDLQHYSLHLMPDDWVFVRDDRTGYAKPAFHRAAVTDDVFNVMRASFVLYRCMLAHLAGAESLGDIARSVGAESVVESFDALAASMHLALRIAENGVENFSFGNMSENT